jgi:hypothetical protein
VAGPVSPQTATLANVASANADTALFVAATGRVNERTVVNDSTANLYLKYGTGASATSYTVKLVAGAYYEFPQPVYGGAVNGFWDAANGNARLSSW